MDEGEKAAWVGYAMTLLVETHGLDEESARVVALDLWNKRMQQQGENSDDLRRMDRPGT